MRQRQESTIVEKLRGSRGIDNAMTRLHENSVENFSERVAKAMSESDWAFGPVKLHSTFGKIHYAVGVDANGDVVRIPVNEDDDGVVSLGRPQKLEGAKPPTDLASEVLETAQAVATALLEDDMEMVPGMVASMASALDYRGDMSRQVNIEIDLQSLREDRWYHPVVAEQFNGNVEVPKAVTGLDSTVESLQASVESLQKGLLSGLAQACVALKESQVQLSQPCQEIGRAVIEDVKLAVRALSNAKVDSEDELLKVYESVVPVTHRLLSGTQFLVQLIQSEQEEVA